MNAVVLDNPAWHALTGAHERFAVVAGRARRYDPDVSVFSAVDELDGGAWNDLATLTPATLAILVTTGPPEPPPGWTVPFSAEALQMWTPAATPRARDEEPVADGGTSIRPLDAADVAELSALVALTEPGPFRPRTIELDGYVGIFHRRDDKDVLVAAAGQRMRPPGHCEVSAVCTHPDARRRGYASALTTRVAASIAARGETPFLHAALTNTAAISVYDDLGFVVRRTMWFSVLRPSP
jgi:GNAT superfamily N-acetyltransferase